MTAARPQLGNLADFYAVPKVGPEEHSDDDTFLVQVTSCAAPGCGEFHVAPRRKAHGQSRPQCPIHKSIMEWRGNIYQRQDKSIYRYG